MNTKKLFIFILLALIFALFAYDLALNNTSFETIRNNTNLAPTIHPEHPGTGERIDNVTYWANTSEIEIHVFAHADNTSQTAGTLLYINDVLVSPRTGRPLGVAETAYRGVDTRIPKGSSYRVDFENYHHYEWREYPILSGKNGTLSINQTNVTQITNDNASIDPFNMNASNITSGTLSRAVLDNYYVNKTGDIMSSGLHIIENNSTDPLLNVTNLDNPTSITDSTIVSRTAGVQGLYIVNTANSSPNQGAGIQAAHDDGAAMGAGHRLGFFFFGGSLDASHNIGNQAGFAAIATSLWNATNRATNFSIFVTKTGTTSRYNALTLNEDGNASLNSLSGSGSEPIYANASGYLFRNSTFINAMNKKVNKTGDNITGLLNITVDVPTGTAALLLNSGRTTTNVRVYQCLNDANDAFSFRVNVNCAGVMDNSSETGWVFAMRPRTNDFTIQRFWDSNNELPFTITGNTSVKMIAYAGTGNAAACFDSTGTLYRSTNATSSYLTC